MVADAPPPTYRGVWPYSSMETFWASADASDQDRCEVVITAEGVTISYRDGKLGTVVIHGAEHGAGHWRLWTAHGSSGSLHAFPDGVRPEGFFADRGWTGMWAVTLSDDPDDA